MVSPRRSGRTTSTPAERSTRSHHKMSPRQKSLSPHDVSDDNPDTQPGAHASLDDQPQTRRSTRAQVHHDDEVDQSGNVIEADDEVTRCICGLQDYPGPPLTDDLPAILDASQAEDAGGLFIQCDKCHVWQHGGCVGIMDERKSPENYFCEQCDKKLHRVMTDPRGQRYSRYLPLHKPEPKSARKPSITKDSDSSKGRKERDDASRASVESSTGKRRSTMNSRQAYDDEETLRRVIEESKGENEPSSVSRKGKRSRDDSEESKHEIKRQRTGSDSPNPPSTLHTASQAADSDEDTPTTKANKKLRGTVAETLRQREAREREVVRNMKRAEAAGRRSERAGRRRAEDSEPAEDMPRLDDTPIPPTSQPPSPPASAPPQAPGSSHKKGAGKKQKRLGRNQYSAPKPPQSPHRAKSQPTLQPTNASSGDDPSIGTNEKNSTSSANDTATPAVPVQKPKPGKWGRGKNARQAGPQDTDTSSNKDGEKSTISLLDMKKRTSLMMEYITKAQVDMAGERTPINGGGAAQRQDEGFKELSSREMMDILTRRIMSWQKDYGGDGALIV